MNIETVRFGNIEIEEDKIIKFKEGIPGFPEDDKFIVILNGEDTPISFLQSVKNGDLSFVILNPFKVYKEYDFEIPETVQKTLRIEKVEDVMIFNMVTIPEDMKKMTANLMAPIVINIREKLGKQIILEDAKYGTKHYVLGDAEQDIEKGGI